MLSKSRAILAAIVIILSGYSLITNNNGLLPFTMLIVAALMLLIGIGELQKDRKGIWGYLSIAIFVFTLYVSVNLFLSN